MGRLGIEPFVALEGSCMTSEIQFASSDDTWVSITGVWKEQVWKWPKISRCGVWIFFVSDRTVGGRVALWVMNVFFQSVSICGAEWTQLVPHTQTFLKKSDLMTSCSTLVSSLPTTCSVSRATLAPRQTLVGKLRKKSWSANRKKLICTKYSIHNPATHT